MADIVVTGDRWMSAKWWDGSAKDKFHQRDDLAERVALSLESLRKAGFVARLQERREQHGPWPDYPMLEEYETILLRVEVYGNSNTLIRARHHLRGFWAALDSRGLGKDYRIGFSSGVNVLQNVGKLKPETLPKPDRTKRLKA